MKQLLLLLGALFTFQATQAQACTGIALSNAFVLQNDTTIVATNMTPELYHHYIPCGKLKIDSASTVQNYIFLRPGSTFICDSMSTIYGGFFVYADSGATVDMNFMACTQLHYTSGTVLIDTNFSSGAQYCPSIAFDFSAMPSIPNCGAPLNVPIINPLQNIQVTHTPDAWNINLPSEFSNLSWELYGLEGKMIRKQKLTGTYLRIDKTALPNNLYILRLTDDNHQQVLKLANW